MKKQSKYKKTSRLLVFVALTILLIASSFLSFEIFFYNRVFPGISIGKVNLSAYSYEDSKKILLQSLNQRLNRVIHFNYRGKIYTLHLSENSALVDTDLPIKEAFSYGRSRFYFKPIDIKLKIVLTNEALGEIRSIAKAINQNPIDSQLKILDGQIIATPSEDGLVLDEEKVQSKLILFIATGEEPTSKLPIKTVSPKFSYQSAEKIKSSLDQIKLSPFMLKFRDKVWELNFDKLVSLLDLQNTKPYVASADLLDNELNVFSLKVGNNLISDARIILDPEETKEYFKTISKDIDQPKQEPLFSFDAGKVTEFRAPQEGRKLNIDANIKLINKSLLTDNKKSVDLIVDVDAPENKDINKLGIKELLGKGISHFQGSIPNRVYNVTLAAQKLNGVLVEPGAIFSFLSTVGDISAVTGYKQAYVIKSGRTVLDDGGGVCQDSTTLFRAVLNAGLPIIERTAHAYRVGYYEQGFSPGLDATVFYPNVDLKFKNDTTSHILIQSYVRNFSLTIELYGTSDGRVTKITTPQVTNQTPPPPELRQDDPTLPKGVIKQVDWAASGAIVEFSRTVTNGTETLISENYKSNYRPWQAVYLVGTKEN